LLDGIHLPNLMRSAGAPARQRRLASGRRRRLLRFAEVALESSLTREVPKVETQTPQLGENISSAPSWMLLMQEQSLLDHVGGRRRHRTIIRRLQRRLTVFTKLLAKSPYRARRQAKLAGDFSRFAALLKS
jgi:hypothetical protein